MNCHDAREQFSALIDDALAADERAALDAHLATCADCRRELQRFRDTVALMRGAAPVRAPAGFVDRVLEAARPVPWHRRLLHVMFLPWPIKLPMEAAAIVLVSVGVAMVYRGSPELQQSARQEPTAAMARRA
ncbi:MAG TPA: zf-HC2 domain-containing protein, partial [Methylomirabilota bacterium]|nr:zf-HC2 domain-containing protein [Methylomirabilota bacterium]